MARSARCQGGLFFRVVIANGRFSDNRVRRRPSGSSEVIHGSGAKAWLERERTNDATGDKARSAPQHPTSTLPDVDYQQISFHRFSPFVLGRNSALALVAHCDLLLSH